MMHGFKLFLCFFVLLVGIMRVQGTPTTATPPREGGGGTNDTQEEEIENQDNDKEIATKEDTDDKEDDKKKAPTVQPPEVRKSASGNAEFYDPNYTPLPNMVAGVRGYNILEGNPFKDSGDPGFVTQLFIPSSLKYGRMELESGITANDLSTCKRSMEAISIASLEGLTKLTEDITKSGYELQVGTETEVTRELSVSGDVKEAKVAGGVTLKNTIPPPFERAWGKSRELQHMSNIFSQEDKMLSVSFGFCEQYEMVIDRTMTPPFTDMLKNGIAILDSATKLNATMKNEAFKLFIEDFGTHFMQEVKMGAQFMATTEYTKLARDKLTAKALNDCSYKKGSKIFGIQVEENSDSCKKEDIDELEKIGNENSKMSIITKGSRPTGIKEWATQDFVPVPVKFKLAPIINLFHPRLFKKWEVQDKDGNEIKAEDIMAWFLPIYWSEVKFCDTMKIDCQKKVGCGLNDKCPVDTQCDRNAPKDKEQACTPWTEWQCTAKCGRGYAEYRTRRCDGCIGATYEEVGRECKGKRGCYTSVLKIKGSHAESIHATVAEIPKNFDHHFSVCVLYKAASHKTSESALFDLISESESVLKILLIARGGLKVVLHETEIVFEDFKDVLKWEHICLIWRHQWSVYGEATLFVNGLFVERKSKGLSKTPIEAKTDELWPWDNAKFETVKAVETPSKKIAVASPGDIIVGGHKSGAIRLASFKGTISGLYIYNRILTAAEVDDSYRGFAPTREEIFTWDDIMSPDVSIPDQVEIESEPINPMDVVSAREDHYYFDNEAVSHNVAETKCEILGGELTSIDAPVQNKQLVEELKKLGVGQFWVGLTRIAGSATWKWSNGEALVDGQWNSWEERALPTSSSEKVCVVVDSNGKWKPEKCTNRFAFACILNEEKIGLKGGKMSSKDGEKSADLTYDGIFTNDVKTQGSDNGWWHAQLNRPAIVTIVHVYAPNGHSYTGFKASTSMDDSSSSWNLCDEPGTKKLPNLFVLTCASPTLGKFIKIESTDGGQLKLSEIQVYGKLSKNAVRFPNPTSGMENGRPYQQGYIEIRHNGVWGTICDHSFKDNNFGAKAVCKMMGFVDGAYAEDYKQEELAAKRNLRVWLDDVTCSSGAESILECLEKPWGVHDNCREEPNPHKHDVGVRCYRSQEMQIRLNDKFTFQGEDEEGHRYIQGPIQFQRSPDKWVYMCGTLNRNKDGIAEHKDDRQETKELEDVASKDANVLCKILGHKRGERRDPVQIPFINRKEQTIATVNCIPGAESLTDCRIVYNDLNKKEYYYSYYNKNFQRQERKKGYYIYQHCTTSDGYRPLDQTSIRCYV